MIRIFVHGSTSNQVECLSKLFNSWGLEKQIASRQSCFCVSVVRIKVIFTPSFICLLLKRFLAQHLSTKVDTCSFQQLLSKITFHDIINIALFDLPSGTVFSLGMREWLLWWSQIRGCSACLTRGDRAWKSRINSMCLCQMESSPTLLRWDNFSEVAI